MARCKYCGATLADDGYCSRPCTKGALDRKVAEDKAAIVDDGDGKDE